MIHKESGYISLGTNQLYYVKTGIGKRLLVAFHGYGNDAYLFTPFNKYLEQDFTIISIDLPHHGKSVWPDKIQFGKKELISLITTIKTDMGVEKVSLMGYSLGGRVCLTAVELMPEIVDKVLLMAPDGLVVNPFYYFATRNYIGRKLFKGFVTKPDI